MSVLTGLLTDLQTGLADIQAFVPEAEAFLAKSEAELETEFTGLEADVVKEVQTLLANPEIAGFIAAAKTLEPTLIAQIEALLAKLGV